MYGLDANRQPVRKVANSPVGWIGWYPVETPPEGTLCLLYTSYICRIGGIDYLADARIAEGIGD